MRNMKNDVDRQISEPTNRMATTPPTLNGENALANSSVTTRAVKNPANEAFVKEWKAYIKNPKRVTNDPMEAHVIGFQMWAQAVKKSGARMD